MVTNKIDSTKLPYKVGDILYSPVFKCTGIIIGYYFLSAFNEYLPYKYGYTLKRLDNKRGHNGHCVVYKPDGTKLISNNYDLYCIPANTAITVIKSLTSYIFKLLKV